MRRTASGTCRARSADSATLKQASSFLESTSGSFVGNARASQTSSIADRMDAEEALLDEAANGPPMKGTARAAYLLQYFSVGLICEPTEPPRRRILFLGFVHAQMCLDSCARRRRPASHNVRLFARLPQCALLRLLGMRHRHDAPLVVQILHGRAQRHRAHLRPAP